MRQAFDKSVKTVQSNLPLSGTSFHFLIITSKQCLDAIALEKTTLILRENIIKVLAHLTMLASLILEWEEYSDNTFDAIGVVLVSLLLTLNM